MANTDKDILITPNVGSSTDDPKIEFKGADGSTTAQVVTAKAYPTNSGTVSFEGAGGQLFSINNSTSGTIFSVNDLSGVPSIEVEDDSTVKIAEHAGNVLVGTPTDNGTSKVQVNGTALFNSVGEKYTAISGTSPTCNVNNAGAFSLTMAGNTTFTFTSPTSGISTGFVLSIIGNGSTITWPSSVDWAGGTAPDAPGSGATNIYVFWTRDGGSTWYGVLSSAAAA